jgi:hypothetical protein
MTIVATDRVALDEALAAKRLTLLLITGVADNAGSRSVHDVAESVLEPWQRVLWIQDLELLSDQERNEWFAMGGRYAVLARRSREVAASGYLTELLLSNGSASGVRIAAKLNEGDR